MVSIGDGTTPRTAALFAFRSAWRCYSVDPMLRQTEWDTRRLTCLAQRIEDCEPRHFDYPVLVVAVHSHAPLHEAVARFVTTGPRAVIAIPCCESQRLEASRPHRRPTRQYVDHAIWSPKNEVSIWEGV